MQAASLRRLAGSITAQALAIVLVSRVFLFLVNWYSLRAIPPDWVGMDRLVGGWARWDAGHYIRIAQNGYTDPVDPGSPAFFPLFPLLMRGAVLLSGQEVTGGRLAAASVVVANLCFLIAVPVFAHLVNRRCGRDVALVATLLLCISPYSLFFSAGYSESLFLMLAVLMFTCVDRRWWLAAALIAGMASASRVTGLALAPALLLAAWRCHASRRDLAGIVVLSPLGIVAYAAFTWRELGDPLALLTAQSGWGGWNERVLHFAKVFLHPHETLFGDPAHLIVLLNVGLWGLWLVSLPWVWRMLDPGIALFTTLLVVGHGLTTWISLGRYLLPAIGFYMVAAVLLTRPGWRDVPRELVVVVSTILLTALTILFGHAAWVI
ncbi:MAG TPA: mannosyltransferase family protein [Thermomicrobiales bacterium]|nr:mannosyltransferase family protein [Thermomicrobiales bacterium]